MILVERPKKTKKTKLLRTRFYIVPNCLFSFFWGIICCTTRR